MKKHQERIIRINKKLAHKMSIKHTQRLKKLKIEVAKIGEENVVNWKPKKIAYYKFLLRKEEASK